MLELPTPTDDSVSVLMLSVDDVTEWWPFVVDELCVCVWTRMIVANGDKVRRREKERHRKKKKRKETRKHTIRECLTFRLGSDQSIILRQVGRNFVVMIKSTNYNNNIIQTITDRTGKNVNCVGTDLVIAVAVSRYADGMSS